EGRNLRAARANFGEGSLHDIRIDPSPKNLSLRFRFLDPPSRGGWALSINRRAPSIVQFDGHRSLNHHKRQVLRRVEIRGGEFERGWAGLLQTAGPAQRQHVTGLQLVD